MNITCHMCPLVPLIASNMTYLETSQVKWLIHIISCIHAGITVSKYLDFTACGVYLIVWPYVHVFRFLPNEEISLHKRNSHNLLKRFNNSFVLVIKSSYILIWCVSVEIFRVKSSITNKRIYLSCVQFMFGCLYRVEACYHEQQGVGAGRVVAL